MGLAILAKEPSVLFCAGIYAFFALAPDVPMKIRHLLGARGVTAITIIPFPLAIAFSGKPKTGGNFLAWQLFRRPNHSAFFYPTVVPVAIGIGVVLAALIGLLLCAAGACGPGAKRCSSAGSSCPAAFFELWPVKGFQYLLPVAPAVALLAARLFTLELRPPVAGRSPGPPLRAGACTGRAAVVARGAGIPDHAPVDRPDVPRRFRRRPRRSRDGHMDPRKRARRAPG